MPKVNASKRMTAWSRVGIVSNDDGDEFASGDVCKRTDRKGQWRIIGIDVHRSGMVQFTVRGEKSGKADRIDIDEAVFLAPPYRAVY